MTDRLPADMKVMADLLDSLGIALCLFDGQDRVVLWNRTFLQFFPEHDGPMVPGEHYRENLRRFYAGRLAVEERGNLDRYVADGIARHRGQSRPFSFTHNGRELRVASLPIGAGHRVRVWVEQRPQLQAAAASATGLPATLFATIADGAMVLDRAGCITAVNDEFAVLYDVGTPSQVIGQTFIEVIRAAWARAEGADGAPERVIAALLDNARFVGAAFEVELPGDRWRRVIERRAPDGTAFIAHSDITILKRQQRALQTAYVQLERLAVTDGLTGIANRRHFEKVLAEEALRSARSGAALSLLLIDLDQLKQLNDRHGHPAGDAALRRVAGLLEAGTRRPGDLVARIGGDEFACVLPQTPAPAARAMAENLRVAIRQPDEGSPPISVSIGAATLPMAAGKADDVKALIEAADRALYAAKHGGRDQVAAAGR